MTNKMQETDYSNNVLGVLVGLFIGGLAGAITVLLLAPQSGEDTRNIIQEKSLQLRDRTTDKVEEAMKQMRADRKKLTHSGQQKAKELLEQGQALVIEQLEHVSDAALSGKKAIQSA